MKVSNFKSKLNKTITRKTVLATLGDIKQRLGIIRRQNDILVKTEHDLKSNRNFKFLSDVFLSTVNQKGTVGSVFVQTTTNCVEYIDLIEDVITAKMPTKVFVKSADTSMVNLLAIIETIDYIQEYMTNIVSLFLASSLSKDNDYLLPYRDVRVVNKDIKTFATLVYKLTTRKDELTEIIKKDNDLIVTKDNEDILGTDLMKKKTLCSVI